MKTNHRFFHAPKWRCYAKSWLCAVVVLAACALSSCSRSEKCDASDLLKTVPSSSSLVGVTSLEKLLEDLNCKVDGSNVELSEEMKSFFQKTSSVKAAKNMEAVKSFLSGESGVDLNCAVLFVDLYNTYATAMVADMEKFRKYVEAQSGEKFAAQGDIETCGNVALKGAQMWMCVSSNNTIDAKAVAGFAELSDSRSFLTNKAASHLSEFSGDMAVWADIKSLASSRKGISSSSLSMVSSTIFSDASSMLFNINFEKGKAECDAQVLDSNGEAAKYLLPAAKVDVATVKKLQGNASLLVAANISAELVKKIQSMASIFSMGQIADILTPIDGTMAYAASDNVNFDKGMRGIVTTNGNPTPALLGVINNIAPAKVDGKYITFTDGGATSGDIEIAKAADRFKGAALGVVVSGDAVRGYAGGVTSPIKTLSAMLEPDHGSLELSIEVTTSNEKENSLLTILNYVGDTAAQEKAAAAPAPSEPAAGAPASEAAPAPQQSK